MVVVKLRGRRFLKKDSAFFLFGYISKLVTFLKTVQFNVQFHHRYEAIITI